MMMMMMTENKISLAWGGYGSNIYDPLCRTNFVYNQELLVLHNYLKLSSLTFHIHNY